MNSGSRQHNTGGQFSDYPGANRATLSEEERERRREKRKNRRKERDQERKDKKRKNRNRKRGDIPEKGSTTTTSPHNKIQEGKRLRTKDFSPSIAIAETLRFDEEPLHFGNEPSHSLLDSFGPMGESVTSSDTEVETFTCVCNDCHNRNTCITDDYCTAISYKEGDQQFTTYGCLNRTENFMYLAYCEGGKLGKSQQNTLRTVCCTGEMCNNVPPPKIPSTTTQKPTVSLTSDQTYTLPHATIYFVLPAVLLAILLIVTVIYLCKKNKSIIKKRAEKQRIKSYLGDSLSAQPLAEDCSLDMPDRTSGSGSGMPMLIQRTVAKGVTLVDQIGTGKYGSVYRGIYQGGHVAVKIFMSKDTKSWERENEIYNTLMLQHDNILGYMASDVISCDSVTKLWLICHYHENGSLYDYLNQPYNIVNLSQALNMLHTAAAGLVHLHTEIFGTQAKPAIAHRDIKSKNILVKDDGTCCIADLGLAVIQNYDTDDHDPNRNKVGTKRYMAPEVLSDQINHRDFESYKRADIYAFSLVMWETIQCAMKDGHSDKYVMPYEGVVNHDPTFEEMRTVVAVQKIRPHIPSHWSSDKLFRKMSKNIQECWNGTPTIRLTILRVKKTLGSILEESRDCKQYV